MLQRDPHKRLDELVENDLARHRLRGLDHRPDIQLLEGRANCRRRRRRCCFLAQPGVEPLELLHLSESPPTRKATTRILQMGACGSRGPAAEKKSCSKLVGDSFVL